MNKIMICFEKIYKQITTIKDRYLEAKTEEFRDAYELAHNEEPSDKRVQKFRKEHVMKLGLICFIFVTMCFLFITN